VATLMERKIRIRVRCAHGRARTRKVCVFRVWDVGAPRALAQPHAVVVLEPGCAVVALPLLRVLFVCSAPALGVGVWEGGRERKLKAVAYESVM
jgi:hypothetical protein